MIYKNNITKCCGCNKLISINAYDYNKNILYSCSIGCALSSNVK